jgi:hypothetical protein
MKTGTGSPLSLALLALMTSGVVVMTRGNDYFSLWDSVVGVIMLSVAAAYRHEVGIDPYYRLAFSLIVGAGLMFVVGPFLESAIYYVHPDIAYEGPLLQTPGKLGYDGVFVAVWLSFAALVYFTLARRGNQ